MRVPSGRGLFVSLKHSPRITAWRVSADPRSDLESCGRRTILSVLAICDLVAKKKHLLPIICVAVVVSQLAKIWIALQWPSYPQLANYMVLGRIDQFGIGAIAACLLRTPEFRYRTWMCIRNSGAYVALPCSIIAVLAQPWIPRVLFETAGRFTIAWATVGLIMAIIDQRNPMINRITNVNWLAKFGLYSYGMYLLHGFLVPWLAITGSTTTELTAKAATHMAIGFPVFIALTYLMASLSYRFFERPLLKLKTRFPY